MASVPLSRLAALFLLLSASVAGCIPTTPTATLTVLVPTPTPSAPVPTQTNTAPALDTDQPPDPEPTTLPTGVVAGPVITAQNAAQVHSVADTQVGYSSRIIWGKNSQSLAVLQESGPAVFRFDPLTVEFELQVPSPQRVGDFSADGHTAAVLVDEQSVELREISNGQAVQTIQPDGIVLGASFSPDGTQIALPSGDEWAVHLFDVASGQFIKTLTGFETAAPIYNALFSADGKSILYWARATLQAQDIATGQMGPALNHEDFVMALATTQDGNTLAAVTGKTVDDTYTPIVQLWDPQSGADLGFLTLPGPSSAVSFSPDGQLLASGVGADILLWDMASQSIAATLSGQTGSITSLAFSPDGTTLASTSDDGQLRLWRATP